MISWADVEDAVRNWVVGTTELGDDFVFFANQDGIAPQPGPWAIISIGDARGIGLDAVDHRYDPAGPAQQEIVYHVNGMREVMVTLEIFSPGSTTGNATARTLAETARSKLRLPRYNDTLNAAGIGVLDASSVRWLPALVDANFEGRALLEVRICLSQDVEDRTGYIATVGPIAANVTP